MKAMRPTPPARLVEARFTFQTDRDREGRYIQFYVRLCKQGDQLTTLFDLYATEESGIIEGLSLEFLDAVRAAFEMVKERFKVQELHEQTE